MPIDGEVVRLFRKSLARVLANANFPQRFYERFMSISPDIAEVFRHKDMARIQGKLRMTLEMVRDHAANEPGLEMYLELLGRMHTVSHISRHHFALWKRAALDTVAECDPLADQAVLGAWERVIDDLIAKMGFAETRVPKSLA